MPNLKLPCQIGGDCDFETISLPYEQAKEQLDGHMRYAHGRAQAVSSNKPETFPRPEIKLDSTAKDWEEFLVAWDQYKAEYNMTGEGLIRQLIACCSEEMKQSLSRLTGGKQLTLSETQLLAHMKNMIAEADSKATAKYIKVNTGFSLLFFAFGIAMVSVGSQNLPLEGEQDPCPNGAAYWLYVAGICYLVSTAINIFSNHYIKGAMRDGRFESSEKNVLNISYKCSAAFILVWFVMVIWGCGVVFRAWASWTDDFAMYSAAKDKFNYCRYTPMVFALTMLILQGIPVLITIIILNVR